MARTQSLFKTITHSNNDQVSSQNWNETTQPDSANLSASDSPTTRKNCNSDLKIKAWKKKSWSFTLSKMKREPLIEEINSKLSNPHNCSSSWEVKELVSRDGQTKLKAEVFFASFDQRSAKAAGESACAAMVAVVAHWLQSNQDSMPTTSQFDSLITEGSSEWRKLCNNDEHVKSFPDNHFDLETVLKAELRPLNILPNKSFTGIFSPEKFENLKGAMSFDDIWDEIRSITEEYDQRIYIVSWNDHFFVLKADFDAYYIIDSLGERLFEGCNQAYILKFDESTLMHGKVAKEEINSETTEANNEVVICKGKECCKEFIKRFLAAIPIMELAEQEKKERVSTFSLLQRLQIDFHYCCSSSPSSMASPTSSLFSTDEGIN